MICIYDKDTELMLIILELIDTLHATLTHTVQEIDTLYATLAPTAQEIADHQMRRKFYSCTDTNG
jgi:hypothetical protein